ncbi:toll/interleukin-1 receptor domain-containing protein [Nocardia aobensis]|uniref:Toll/interleukin-1 receptor domain-containing protein n=1 Tax=Nocardia aobensis TaxID=257277 RepID=A0ABW6NZI9_9NOCA
MANVFISHRGADLIESERLKAELQSLGHTVWIDSENIDIGDSIIGAINDGLAGTNYLVLCLSKHGIGPSQSPYTAKEWMSALARQLSGLDIKILPVRLTGDEVPAILADLKYADLITDWNAGVQQLHAALK